MRDAMFLNVVVDDSLINTTLQVIIMQGQLDVICNTGGVYVNCNLITLVKFFKTNNVRLLRMPLFD